ncbi:hypothetical protein BRAS3843_1850013 [Bradyrhizobium sp. STM 3843]|nr:hypothetical protein BRAS3843_1850013 [Bradyrhizobium sp. STM 3843]
MPEVPQDMSRKLYGTMDRLRDCQADDPVQRAAPEAQNARGPSATKLGNSGYRRISIGGRMATSVTGDGQNVGSNDARGSYTIAAGWRVEASLCHVSGIAM